MANNTLNLYTSVLIPLALKRLSAVAGAIQTITKDVSEEQYEANDLIKLQLRNKGFVAKDFVTSAESQDLQSRVKEIRINKHKHVSFEMTDKEMLNIKTNQLLSNAVEDAVGTLGEQVCSDVYNLYKEVYNFSGSNSANKMAVNDIYYGVRKMFANRVNGQLYTALNGMAYTDLATELRLSSNTSDSISDVVTRTGEFNQIAGTNAFRDQLLTPIYHVAGTAKAKTLTTSGVTAAGATSIVVDGLAAGDTFVKGDLIEVNDGSGQQFVVTADVTSTGATATIEVSPEVGAEIADATSLTMIDDHEVNLMYTRDFAIFVMRALNKPSAEVGLLNNGSIQDIVVDPNTGLSLRYEVHRKTDDQKIKWTFDILYAVEVIDPIYACRVLTA